MSSDLKPAMVDEVCAVAAAHADRADRGAEFPVEALTAMRRTGLLGLLVPAEHGGLGGGPADLVDVTLAIGRADLSVAMIFAMHCQQVAVLDRYGSPGLRAEVLPRVARGEEYLASVTTEAGKGGHLLTAASPTSTHDGLLRVDRSAPIVTGGRHADGFLATLRAPDATTPHQVELVYLRRDQVEKVVLGDWNPLGMRATDSVPMRLTGDVPRDQTVGEPGGFRKIAVELFAPLAHLGWAAAWLGTAAGALSRVTTHLRGPGRSQLDTSSTLQMARLADVRSRLDVVHALLRHTQRVVEDGELGSPSRQLLINALKIRAAEDCFTAVHELIELIGLRHGYLVGSELHLERAFRDLRSASLNYGNDRLRLSGGALTLLDTGVRFA